jgi:hypothetical protein
MESHDAEFREGEAPLRCGFVASTGEWPYAKRCEADAIDGSRRCAEHAEILKSPMYTVERRGVSWAVMRTNGYGDATRVGAWCTKDAAHTVLTTLQSASTKEV